MKAFLYAFLIALTATLTAAAVWYFVLDRDDNPSGKSDPVVDFGPSDATGVTDGATSALGANDPAVALAAKLRRSFRRLERELGNPAGVSFGPLDGSGQTTLGSLRTGPAWSTSKVPVAVAVLNEGGSSGSAMTAAITQSDNRSAESLWASLGSPKAAGAKVDQVFRDAGDERTDTQTEVVRPPFTAFGQTIWSIAQQQRMARYVACNKSAAPVYRLMGRVVPDQSWGLAVVDAKAHIKGGWGPTTSDGYLVRQLGVMRAEGGGKVAVAMIVDTAASDLKVGATQLSRIAEWVSENSTGSTRC